MPSDTDYSLYFQETGWVCPFCIDDSTDEETGTFNRDDIPAHLVYQHDWEPGKHFNWEYIYNRLIAVGGV